MILFVLAATQATIAQDKTYENIEVLLQTNSASSALKAISELKQIDAKEAQSSAQYWMLYAKACANAFRFEEALQAYNKAIEIAPKEAKYYFEKANYLTTNSIYLDTALVALETAVSLDPIGEYYYWKGIVHQRLQQKTAAILAYNKAITLGIQRPELYNNLGIALVEEQKLEEAIQHLSTAITLDSNYLAAYNTRAKTYIMLNNIAAACQDQAHLQAKTKQDLGLLPDSICTSDANVQTRFAAEIALMTQQYNAAIKHYSQLIASKNTIADDYLNRGYIYFQTKDYKKAEADYLKALTLPDAATDQIYDNLSLLYFEQNKMQQAIEYSTKRVVLDPQNPVPYLDRGLAKRKLKKYDEAEKDFNKCLEIDPNFFRAYGYRAYLNLEKGDINKAFMDATKAIEINKEYGYAYLVLGELKVQLNTGDYCDDFRNAAKYGESAGINAIELYCK